MTLPRFSLRLLLAAVAVAVLCLWLAWERSVVMARRRYREEAGRLQIFLAAEPIPNRAKLTTATVPWVRRLFGNEPIQIVYVWKSLSQTETDRAARLFPEAVVSRAVGDLWSP